MKCKECEADGEYGCRAGFTSIIIDGEWGCRDADRLLDAYHFNQVKGDSSTSTQTHADRIRAKSDEELAEFFGTLPCCPPGADLEELCFPQNSCAGTDLMVKCWLKWLRQEAEE